MGGPAKGLCAKGLLVEACLLIAFGLDTGRATSFGDFRVVEDFVGAFELRPTQPSYAFLMSSSLIPLDVKSMTVVLSVRNAPAK